MTLTPSLAKLIVSSSPFPTAHEAAREGLLDSLAVTLPVLRGDFPDAGLNSLHQVYRADDPPTRALLLGYVEHTLDFDDFHPNFHDHPSVAILPALLALVSQRPDINGAHFPDTYVTGVEMSRRLGLVVGSQHYTLGFHNTATLGTIAAAAACTRLVHTMERQTAVILGITTTQSVGLHTQFGSDVKPLHAGLAAQTAVIATQLTLAGSHGQPDSVLDSFLPTYCAGQQQPEKLISGQGVPRRIISPGLEFKPYPTCGGAHSTADAARALCQEWLQAGNSTDVLIAAIERIEMLFPPGSDIAVSVRKPNTGVEARFSLEYMIAACLLRGGLRLEDFSSAPVATDIAALAESVTHCPDFSASSDELNPAARFHQVTVFLRDGSVLQQRFTRQQNLAIPFDLPAKLHACLPDFTDAKRIELVALSRLENRDSLSRLVDMLFAKQINAASS